MRTGRFLSVARGEFHAVSYVDWGPLDAVRVAVCVHGLTRQGRDFDVLAESLVRRGWRVVCPDLVGRGLSGRLKDPDDYGLPQYVVDMTMLVAHLGVDEVDWIGTSLGGLIGVLMASKEQTPVRSLVINDIGPHLPWLALRRIGEDVRAAPRSYPDFASAVRHVREVYAPFGRLTDGQWEHLARHSFFETEQGTWVSHFDPGIGEAFRPGRIFNNSFWQFWDRIRCPTLVLRGQRSDLLRPDTAQQMMRRGPRADLIEFPDCGHAPALLDSGQTALVADWVERSYRVR
ncbi:alpha/beta fold hydrolase [Methylobacterium sp. Gmos1]